MYDVWDTIGLRGTATDAYSVENLFIPEKFVAQRDDMSAVRENGPLYKLTTNAVFSMGFAATSCGVARATLDAAIDLARSKIPQGLGAMKDNSAVQGVIGRTEASLRAARAYLYATAAEIWRDLERGERITEERRIAIRIAATWTIHQCGFRGRHRLSHVRRDGGVCQKSVRAAFSRHARHRAADPGARHPL